MAAGFDAFSTYGYLVGQQHVSAPVNTGYETAVSLWAKPIERFVYNRGKNSAERKVSRLLCRSLSTVRGNRSASAGGRAERCRREEICRRSASIRWCRREMSGHGKRVSPRTGQRVVRAPAAGARQSQKAACALTDRLSAAENVESDAGYRRGRAAGRDAVLSGCLAE